MASLAAHCAVDAAGNCHLVGWYQGQATFGNQTLQPQGFLNYFLTTIPADEFAGVYPNLAWDYNDNVIYLEEDGVEKSTEGYLKIVRNDATHYAAEIREGPDGAVIPNLVRTGNRLQLDSSPMDMGDHNILDFIMLSDGTNRVFAGTGQEKSDASDISITVHSWSDYTGIITVDDFVGNWDFRSHDDDLLDPDDHFSGSDDNQFEMRKTGANTIEAVTPWGYSLPLRVVGNEAYLETPTQVPGHPKYFTFRICTDGQKLSFHTIGKDFEDDEIFAVVGLGVKQPPPTNPVVATLAVTDVTSNSATLNGTVNPNGLASTAQFEYGLTTAYGSTASVTLSPNNGSTPQNVSAVLSGLEPGKTYHYRLTATNSGGTGAVTDQTFTTNTVAPATPSGNWLLAKGFPANTNLLSDPNGDGVSLLMAYAFNLNPAHNLGGSLPRPVISATDMSVTFYSGNADVNYLVETSTDLSVWSTTGVTLSTADANGFRTATFLKAGPSGFMRLRPVIMDSFYGPWRAARFSTAELANDEVSGDLADPDRDLVPNLLEYAMGGQPKASDTGFAPTAGSTAGYLTLTYRQSKSATDIAFMPQATDNPAGGVWSAAGLAEIGRTDHGTYWLVTVRDAVPIASSPRRFMRLMVSSSRALPLSVPVPVPEGFALIPAGEFQMGDQSNPLVGYSSELPVHAVQVSAFYMAKYEVTKELWDTARAWGLNNGYTDLSVGNGSYASKGANHPVHSISWYDMVKWCNALSQKEGLTACYTVDGGQIYKTGGRNDVVCNWSASGYRLPTEAEWEKAARGGVTGKNFPWSTDTISQSQANYRVNSSNGTTNYYSYDVTPRPPATGNDFYHPSYTAGGYPYSSPVGSFPANGYGLYDMAGNMWEWCWDWYGSYSSGSQTDPRGPTSGSYRVIRGGSWYLNASYCRVADRGYYGPSISYYYFGFRIARSSVP